MGLRVLPFAIAIAALLLAPDQAHPQTLPTYVHRLPEEAEVRLELAGGEMLRGRIAHHDSATLTLHRLNRDRGHSPFREQRIIALDAVVRGWTYGGNHWKLGTAVGAGVGVLAMLIAREITLSTQDGASCHVGGWSAALGVGAIIGSSDRMVRTVGWSARRSGGSRWAGGV